MASQAHTKQDRNPWSWRFAFASRTDLDKATKAVLQVIAMHVNDCGEGCFPSISTIEIESGYSRKPVIKAIEQAQIKGWLKVEKHGFKGQKWKRNHYIPHWPDREYGGGATPLPSDEKVVDSRTEGGGVQDHIWTAGKNVLHIEDGIDAVCLPLSHPSVSRRIHGIFKYVG